MEISMQRRRIDDFSHITRCTTWLEVNQTNERTREKKSRRIDAMADAATISTKLNTCYIQVEEIECEKNTREKKKLC